MGSSQIPTEALIPSELKHLDPIIRAHHTFGESPDGNNNRYCTSLIAHHIDAPAAAVWPFIRDFYNPQRYKHFIKKCRRVSGSGDVGSLREVTVVSGLPASASTERLEILDEDRRMLSFSVVGGDHRLKNYHSVTTVNGFAEEEQEEKGGGGRVYTVVLESYIVEVPEGNTREDTKMFADTVVKLNLQKLADVALASLTAPPQQPTSS